jgi:hypothetical protein
VILEGFRPLTKGTLRGFARVAFNSGFILDEISIHVSSDDGHCWAMPPGRPMVDQAGNVMRDPRTGKLRYSGLCGFTTAAIRRRWSDEIVALVRERHPGVFK